MTEPVAPVAVVKPSRLARLKALYMVLTAKSTVAQIHRLITAALVVYEAFHRAGL